jgi:hypothetical protein
MSGRGSGDVSRPEHAFDTGAMTAIDWTPGLPTGPQQILSSDWPKYPENFVERPPMPVWVSLRVGSGP